MALPGEKERNVATVQRWRLAIGERKKNEAGKEFPAKLDHFRLVRATLSQGYVPDVAAQKAMCEAAGVTQNPAEIPVTVIGNPSIGSDGKPVLPPSILFAEVACYPRRQCSCGEWDETGQGVAVRKTYEKRRGADGKETSILVSTQDVICDPRTCTRFLGTDPLRCKPHVVLSVVLPFFPTVGAVAKLKTTGWYSYYSMRDSLLMIAAQTNGWLHEVPLMLCLGWIKSADGNTIPELRFEYRGSVEELRAHTVPKLRAWHGQQEQLTLLQEGAITSTREMIEDPLDEENTAAEFYPESAESARAAVPPPPPPPPKAAAKAAPKKVEVPPPVPSEVIEGDFEPEPEAAREERQSEPQPEPEAEAPPAPPADEPLSAPVSPLFPIPPADCMEVRARLVALGEEKLLGKILPATWNKVTGKPRTVVPTRVNTESEEQFQELLAGLVERAERWWETEGYDKHSQGVLL